MGLSNTKVKQHHLGALELEGNHNTSLKLSAPQTRILEFKGKEEETSLNGLVNKDAVQRHLNNWDFMTYKETSSSLNLGILNIKLLNTQVVAQHLESRSRQGLCKDVG